MSKIVTIIVGLFIYQCLIETDLYKDLHFNNGICEKKNLQVVRIGGGRSWIDADDICLIDSNLVANTSLAFEYKGKTYYIPVAKHLDIDQYQDSNLIIDIIFLDKKDHLNIRYLSYISNIKLMKNQIIKYQ